MKLVRLVTLKRVVGSDLVRLFTSSGYMAPPGVETVVPYNLVVSNRDFLMNVRKGNIGVLEGYDLTEGEAKQLGVSGFTDPESVPETPSEETRRFAPMRSRADFLEMRRHRMAERGITRHKPVEASEEKTVAKRGKKRGKKEEVPAETEEN